MPFALGIFESSPFEKEIIAAGIFEGEEALQQNWLAKIESILSQTSLQLPDLKLIKPLWVEEQGKHTEHLQPLLDEMSEVFNIDPNAEW
ncbi:MAG: Phenylacetic acid catabolic protein [Cytophagales bacterium]|nr:Phenylacetic acid catabolic protein [Cytophagales bacterium]